MTDTLKDLAANICFSVAEFSTSKDRDLVERMIADYEREKENE